MMVESIKEIGLWDNLMGLESLLGPTVKSIKDNMYTVKNKVKALLLGQMAKFIVEDGIKVNSMEMVK